MNAAIGLRAGEDVVEGFFEFRGVAFPEAAGGVHIERGEDEGGEAGLVFGGPPPAGILARNQEREAIVDRFFDGLLRDGCGDFPGWQDGWGIGRRGGGRGILSLARGRGETGERGCNQAAQGAAVRGSMACGHGGGDQSGIIARPGACLKSLLPWRFDSNFPGVILQLEWKTSA